MVVKHWRRGHARMQNGRRVWVRGTSVGEGWRTFTRESGITLLAVGTSAVAVLGLLLDFFVSVVDFALFMIAAWLWAQAGKKPASGKRRGKGKSRGKSRNGSKSKWGRRYRKARKATKTVTAAVRRARARRRAKRMPLPQAKPPSARQMYGAGRGRRP